MKNHLEITIPDMNAFYSLYAEGKFSWKTYDREKKHTLIYYPPQTVVILYYTYITYRQACVIRHTLSDDAIMLPGLDRKVTQLFSVQASRVDKLKRAVGWLERHSAGAGAHDDGFYARLVYLIEQRGKLNYAALSKLAEDSPAQNQLNLF